MSSTHSSNEDQSSALYIVADKILQQSIDLLGTLKDEEYVHMSVVMPGSTIGKHIRHVNDHFRLLFESLDDTLSAEWVVDYDKRDRNNPSETDRAVAIENIRLLQQKLIECKQLPIDGPLILLATIDSEDANKYRFPSSLSRELFYSCIHAIHHYASIKAICIEMNVDIPSEFGIAPSTLLDQKKNSI
ncbi:hypothetical protein BDB01DRAFT_772407 [Pilobolus umbonatus]|nr:hypothetical protein BDB01DRAFT_772407 [Pilobolus umbonatus]